MSKPWVELTPQAIAALPAQLGVYQVGIEPLSANRADIHRIGFAGGAETFGIRTALERELAAGATRFRHEFTHGYLTRWQELLMVFEADHGHLPPGNESQIGTLGRLSPLANEME